MNLFVQATLDGFFEGPKKAKVPLRLAETRSFGKGVVLLRYERLRAGGDARPG